MNAWTRSHPQWNLKVTSSKGEEEHFVFTTFGDEWDKAYSQEMNNIAPLQQSINANNVYRHLSTPASKKYDNIDNSGYTDSTYDVSMDSLFYSKISYNDRDGVVEINNNNEMTTSNLSIG